MIYVSKDKKVAIVLEGVDGLTIGPKMEGGPWPEKCLVTFYLRGGVSSWPMSVEEADQIHDEYVKAINFAGHNIFKISNQSKEAT